MASAKAWITAFRLRTLPLALSSVILGSFLARYHHSFHWGIAIMAVATTLFLQILSNLANDYGDAVHGVDNHGRIGPQRGIQKGEITLKEMKTAVILFTVLSFISGILLLYIAFKGYNFSHGLIMLLIGIAAIGAALKYTVGKNPYGYAGLGDFAVFLFFGFTGVLGTFFLHTHFIGIPEILPAMAIGFFSTGVLNLNNLRDRENDAAFGKRTIVVKLGLAKAKTYHTSLLLSGMICAVAYSILSESGFWQWLYVLVFPFFVRSIMVVNKNNDPALLDPELKRLAISTLLLSVLFGVGLVV